MKINLADIRHRWNKAKLTKSAAFWVAIGAVILTTYLGFSRGGWVTGGNARLMAESATNIAVLERLAPICVVQFNQDLDKDQKLEELKLINSPSQRTRYVKEQGWATMPGEAKPDDRIATECTKQLLLIGE